MEKSKKKLINDEMTEMIIEETEKMVSAYGAEKMNVTKILNKLNITNRVFYNRFNNIDEVLERAYLKIVIQIRNSISQEYDGSKDFFEYVKDIVVNTLIMSYEIKRKFNQYVFLTDSSSKENYNWYMNRISDLIKKGKELGVVDDVDTEATSYAFWCFCRGFNVDAVLRKTKEEAVVIFREALGILLEGIRKK